MSEQRLIQQTSSPRTRESLAHDLCALGAEAGMTLEVHSSLSKLGWVCGGPPKPLRFCFAEESTPHAPFLVQDQFVHSRM